MKKIDLSKINIQRINDVLGYTLPESSFGKGKVEHNTLIIKRSGKSIYKVNGKTLTADANNIVFLASGTDYHMDVDTTGVNIMNAQDRTINTFNVTENLTIDKSLPVLVKIYNLNAVPRIETVTPKDGFAI